MRPVRKIQGSAIPIPPCNAAESPLVERDELAMSSAQKSCQVELASAKTGIDTSIFSNLSNRDKDGKQHTETKKTLWLAKTLSRRGITL